MIRRPFCLMLAGMLLLGCTACRNAPQGKQAETGAASSSETENVSLRRFVYDTAEIAGGDALLSDAYRYASGKYDYAITMESAFFVLGGDADAEVLFPITEGGMEYYLTVQYSRGTADGEWIRNPVPTREMYDPSQWDMDGAAG